MNPLTDSGLHWAYRIGIVLKGIDGVLELAGGLALLLVTQATLWHLVTRITGVQLAENPHDFIASLMVHWKHHMSAGSQTFAGIYLVAHGAIKIGLVAGLLRGVRIAYPVAIILLSGFIGYQVFRVSHTLSIALGLFTTVDVVIVVLIWREWRRVGAGR